MADRAERSWRKKKLVLMKAQRYQCSTISLLTSALRV
jgi:hypothetical protein